MRSAAKRAKESRPERLHAVKDTRLCSSLSLHLAAHKWLRLRAGLNTSVTRVTDGSNSVTPKYSSSSETKHDKWCNQSGIYFSNIIFSKILCLASPPCSV